MKDEDPIIKISTGEEWIMKIERKDGKCKISFNTEGVDLSPEEMALKIIDILCKSDLLDDMITDRANELLKEKEDAYGAVSEVK